jgi:hypothetical protein
LSRKEAFVAATASGLLVDTARMPVYFFRHTKSGSKGFKHHLDWRLLRARLWRQIKDSETVFRRVIGCFLV